MPKRYQHSNMFYNATVIIGILGFIGGIAGGFVFKVVDLSPYSSQTHFNTALMFGCWVSTIFMCLVFYGIYCILNNQEIIMSKAIQESKKRSSTSGSTSQKKTNPPGGSVS